MRTIAIGVGLLLVHLGCANKPSAADEDKPQLTPELQSLVLDEAPSDVPNPTYIDFGSKAHLIGYSVEPARLAAPGSRLSLKLFWRATGELSRGYQVFTELVTPAGKRFEVEGNGPVRKGALLPEHWEPGKIYIDALDVTVPEELEAARFSIVVGLKTAPIAEPEPESDADDDPKKDSKASGSFGDVYLPVVSGLADSKHGGVIATLETGTTPGAKRARAAKDDKRAAGPKRAPMPQQPGRPPQPTRPRDPGARPAAPTPPAQNQ